MRWVLERKLRVKYRAQQHETLALRAQLDRGEVPLPVPACEREEYMPWPEYPDEDDEVRRLRLRLCLPDCGRTPTGTHTTATTAHFPTPATMRLPTRRSDCAAVSRCACLTPRSPGLDGYRPGRSRRGAASPTCTALLVGRNVHRHADELPQARRKKRNVTHLPMVVYNLEDNEIAEDCKLLKVPLDALDAY